MRVRRTVFSFASAVILTIGSVAPSQAESIDGIAGFSSLSDLQSYVEQNPNQFAGMYLDRQAGTVYVNTAPHVEAISLTRVKRSYLTDKSVPGQLKTVQNVVTRQVKYSYSELEQVKRDIASLQPWASHISGIRAAWGILPHANKVRVGLTKVTPEIQKEAQRLFGDKIELHEEPRAETLPSIVKVASTPRKVKLPPAELKETLRAKTSRVAVAGPPLTDSEPYIGGDRMFREIFRDGGEYVEECTVAFTWASSASSFAMSSAGHCGPNNVAWSQGYYDRDANTLYETGGMGTQFVSAFQPNNADAMLLGSGSYLGQMWENTTGAYKVARVTYSHNAIQGQNVCLNGSFSGTRCAGVVEVPDECLDLNGIWPDTGVAYTVPMCFETRLSAGVLLDQSGDSGGPAFYGHPGDGVGASGIISAGTNGGTTAWYTSGAGARANFQGDFLH